MKKKLLFFQLSLWLIFPAGSQTYNAEEIYSKVNDAVVRIYSYHGNGTQHAQASGVIIKDKGWVVTNYHVLGDGETIRAEHKGKVVKLDSVIAMDADKDVLILRLSESQESPPESGIPDLKIGDSDKLRVGQKIYAIGSPYGFENTITEGIISGLRSSFDSTQNFIQISAPVSSGSSGGAIVNEKGELIGISTLIIAGETAQNLNFAILINDVLNIEKNSRKTSNKTSDWLANYYYQKGFNYYLSKNYEMAISYYQFALGETKKESSASLLYYNIGLTFYKLSLYDSAIISFNKSLKILESANVYSGLGSAYFELKDFEKAIQHYNKAVLLSPNSYEHFLGLGIVYYEQKDYSNALTNLKKAATLNRYSPRTNFLLGKISFDNGFYEIAVFYFKEAIRLDSYYADAYLALGDVYLKLNDAEKAIECQQTAYRLNPKLKIINKNLYED